MTCFNIASGLQAAIDRQLPLRNGIAIGAAMVMDHREELLDEEKQDLQSENPARWLEYSTGRALCHALMRELSIPVQPVRREKGRAPVWPAEVNGSISHSASLAVAVLAKRDVSRSLGIDLERVDRLKQRLAGKVLTPSEQDTFSGQMDLAVAFAAKEAGYKATYPFVRHYIGFHEAEVRIDWERHRFSLRYVGARHSARVMEAAAGTFLIHNGYVLAIADIPVAAPERS